jgi:23S rRNA (uracil1939-C5)-methyltransferase
MNKPELLAHITSLSHDGRGIAHIDGKTTFIFGALPQETVMFSYTRKHRSYDEGQVTSILQASEKRVQPACEHFGVCGGCSMQHVDSNFQIEAKQAILLEHLSHIGGTVPEKILPVLKSHSWGYRHKARLGVKYVAPKQKVLVGFREQNGRYIADLNSCEILHPSVGKKLTQLSELIQSLTIFQSIPQIEVAISDAQTALILRHLEMLNAEDTQKLIDCAQQENFAIYTQSGGIDSIKRLWPQTNENYLSYYFSDHDITLRFQPSDFTQINPHMNRQMINRALELLEPNAHERILDLFCGLGNFTLPLARYCSEVIGVEGNTSLVQAAQENAKINKLNNVTFHCADLTKDFSQTTWAKTPFDKVLLDPPRAGAIEIIPSIVALNPQRILYISCHPTTLARDTKEITKHDYKLTQAGVMDMFPHTSHVESIALFEKRYA